MVKNLPANALEASSIPRLGSSPGVGWLPTPVFFLGKSYGHRSLVVYNSWSHKESDTT